MYEVLKAGGMKNGGFNFDSKTRRASYTTEDLALGFNLGMDAYAIGLINAARIIEDGRIDSFVRERYQSFASGIGAKIRAGKATLPELAAYAETLGAPALPGSGRQEYLQGVLNQLMCKG